MSSGVFAGILGGDMQDHWHSFDIWRDHQRVLLGEAEAQRLAREARPVWRERIVEYLRLFDEFTGRLLGLGRQVVPSHRAFSTDEEVAPSGPGLVEAQVRSSSVIELRKEEEGYVIQEVDLGTGNHILYLSTEEPEWAAWIWNRKTHD
jgi:hypothetical protein